MGDVVPFKKEASAEKKVPPHIKKFYDLMEKVEGALHTTDFHHRKAFLEGESTLMEDGVLNYDLLKDEDRQKKYVNAISGAYINAAKKYFKIDDVKGDEIFDERLMGAYAGFTKSQLSQMVKKHKEKFTYDFFDKNYKPEFMKALQEQLLPIPGSHLKKTHINDILSHTKAKDLLDGTKLKLEQAVALLGHYRHEGTIPKGVLEQLNIPDYAVKKPEYRSDYKGPKEKAA